MLCELTGHVDRSMALLGWIPWTEQRDVCMRRCGIDGQNWHTQVLYYTILAGYDDLGCGVAAGKRRGRTGSSAGWRDRVRTPCFPLDTCQFNGAFVP
jgi:hypothetical protein